MPLKSNENDVLLVHFVANVFVQRKISNYMFESILANDLLFVFFVVELLVVKVIWHVIWEFILARGPITAICAANALPELIIYQNILQRTLTPRADALRGEKRGLFGKWWYCYIFLCFFFCWNTNGTLCSYCLFLLISESVRFKNTLDSSYQYLLFDYQIDNLNWNTNTWRCLEYCLINWLFIKHICV